MEHNKPITLARNIDPLPGELFVQVEKKKLLGGRGSAWIIPSRMVSSAMVVAHRREGEEFAIAFPIAVVVRNIVSIIVTFDRYTEAFELKAILFLCVAFCFFNFADHSVVHGNCLLDLKWETKRHAEILRALVTPNRKDFEIRYSHNGITPI